MKAVLLYGPPAVGKLTIAKELSRLTGFKILHNHLIADLVSAVSPYGTKEYSKLATELKMMVWGRVVRSSAPGAIFTLAYGLETYRGKYDDELIKGLLKEAKRAHSKVYFVKLEASEKILGKRARDASRRRFGKLKDPVLLKKIMRSFKPIKAVPFVESFVVDTEKLSARRSAQAIFAYINSHITRVA